MALENLWGDFRCLIWSNLAVICSMGPLSLRSSPILSTRAGLSPWERSGSENFRSRSSLRTSSQGFSSICASTCRTCTCWFRWTFPSIKTPSSTSLEFILMYQLLPSSGVIWRATWWQTRSTSASWKSSSPLLKAKDIGPGLAMSNVASRYWFRHSWSSIIFWEPLEPLRLGMCLWFCWTRPMWYLRMRVGGIWTLVRNLAKLFWRFLFTESTIPKGSSNLKSLRVWGELKKKTLWRTFSWRSIWAITRSKGNFSSFRLPPFSRSTSL
mmetsp:Transcript_42973/g.41337  ORF Transcript_42973/g.41337 Transcript_42973/m.41337 type:complete len:268 (-) Transcript_42973:1318-2121(-)